MFYLFSLFSASSIDFIFFCWFNRNLQLWYYDCEIVCFSLSFSQFLLQVYLEFLLLCTYTFIIGYVFLLNYPFYYLSNCPILSLAILFVLKYILSDRNISVSAFFCLLIDSLFWQINLFSIHLPICRLCVKYVFYRQHIVGSSFFGVFSFLSFNVIIYHLFSSHPLLIFVLLFLLLVNYFNIFSILF